MRKIVDYNDTFNYTAALKFLAVFYVKNHLQRIQIIKSYIKSDPTLELF